MVRTKADNTARKAVAAKAPRKVLGSSSGGGGAGSSSLGSPAGKAGKYAGGNSAMPRPTPDWQKGIGSFFTSTCKTAEEKENTEPEMDAEEQAASGACSDAQEGSASSNSEAKAEESPKNSPVKRNGLISDSDEDD